MQSWFEDNENTLPDDVRNSVKEKIQHLKGRYASLSDHYQSSKSENQIPLN